MTKNILNTCAAAAGLDYVGGGSGTAETGMEAGTQEIGPMSRFLKAAAAMCNTKASGADLTKAQGRVVGFDGIAITTDGDVSSPVDPQEAVCGNTLANGTLLNGVGSDGFDVFKSDGTPAVNCTGCQAGTNHYAFKPPGSTTDAGAGAPGAWKDVLRIIYFGMLHNVGTPANGDLSAQDCAGDVRRSLVNNYGAIFKGGCSNLGECATGLHHAFRRDDQSGTTDTFISLLGAFPFPAVGTNAAANAASGLGTDDTTTCAIPLDRADNGACGFKHKASPFCNGRELEDRDPIRRECFTPTCLKANGNADGTNNTDCGFVKDSTTTRVKCVFANAAATSGKCYGDEDEEMVCGVDGKLGLVLPIVTPELPDLTPLAGDNVGEVPTVDALYSMPSCGAGNRSVLFACAKYTDYKTQAVSFQCPDVPVENDTNIAGLAFTPTILVNGVDTPCWCDGDPNKCKTVFAPTDHRAFNLFMRRSDFSVVNNIPIKTPAGLNPPAAQINKTTTPRDANRVLGLGTPNYPPSTLVGIAGITNNGPFTPAGADYNMTRFYPVIASYWRMLGAPQKAASERCALNVTTTACTVDADCGASVSEGSRCINPSTGTGPGPGFCTQPNSDTRQIGCLAAEVDCSIGYAGKESATAHPDTKALVLDDIVLTDATVKAVGTAGAYPLARKLYLNSLKGLQGCLGAACTNVTDPLEKAFAGSASGCYGNLSTVQLASTKATFVAVDQLDCQDFNETQCNTLSGCSANTDCGAGQTCTAGVCSCSTSADCLGGRTCVSGSCTFASNSHSCCGDGVVSPLEGETCEPPNTATCSATCTTIP